jgi:hypothetical protein
VPLAAPVRRRGLKAALGACALLVLIVVAPAAAQGVRLRGEVRVATNGDSVPLPGAWVLLHEVTMTAGGARDSMRTDARGRFDLRLAQVDTTALYMVSTTYRGITYFSEAVTHAMSQDTVAPLVVFDTSSTSPPVTVAQRHIVVRGAGRTGGHSVLELIGLENDGDRTRVAGDPPRPTWVGRVAEGATNFNIGQGDLNPDAVQFTGDSVVVTAPIPPGVKQLIVSYDLPAGPELRIPIDQRMERILVLFEDTTTTVTQGPVMRRGVQVFSDRQFAVFDGAAPAADGMMVFKFGKQGVSSTFVLVMVVGIVAAALLFAMPFLLRRRPAVVVAPPPDTPEALARAIASLDAQHDAQPNRTPADEEAYRERRAMLKEQLAHALARAQGQSL